MKTQPLDSDIGKQIFGEDSKKDVLFRKIRKYVNTENENSEKLTVFISKDDLNKLQEIRNNRLKTGKKRSEVNVSTLVREAIKLLIMENA